MDGGVSQTSTHADVVAGVKRAVIVSLTDGGSNAVKHGLRTSVMPNTLQAEVKALEAQGTKTKLIVCGLSPGMTHIKSLVDPTSIKPMMTDGRSRGVDEAKELVAFWN